MILTRATPGTCPICGAAHTACTSAKGPITSVQLPSRDAVESVMVAAATAPMNLGDGSDGRPFSTATYRGGKKKP